MQKFFKYLLRSVLVVFILLNIIVAFHAYKFTHFYNNGEITVKKKEEKTGWDKAKEMFLHSLVIVSTHAGKEFTNILGFDVDAIPNSLQTYCVKDILRWRRSTGFVFSTKKIKHQQ